MPSPRAPSWRDAFRRVIDDLSQRLRSLFSNVGSDPAGESPSATTSSPNPTGGPSQAPRVRFTAESVPSRLAAEGALPWMPVPIHESATVATTLPAPSPIGPANGCSASTPHPVRLPADHHPKSSTIDGKPILRSSQSPPSRQSFGRSQPQPQPPGILLHLREFQSSGGNRSRSRSRNRSGSRSSQHAQANHRSKDPLDPDLRSARQAKIPGQTAGEVLAVRASEAARQARDRNPTNPRAASPRKSRRRPSATAPKSPRIVSTWAISTTPPAKPS
jgi:hypothetical protein